jgi:hypothetical protein
MLLWLQLLLLSHLHSSKWIKFNFGRVGLNWSDGVVALYKKKRTNSYNPQQQHKTILINIFTIILLQFQVLFTVFLSNQQNKTKKKESKQRPR